MKTDFKRTFSSKFVVGCLLAGLFSGASTGLFLPKAYADSNTEKNSADVPVSKEKTLFRDNENGYSLEFPPGWKTEKDRIVNVVAAPLESFKSPNPIPNVKIVVRDIPPGHTIDTICDTSIRQWNSIWKIESDEHSNEGKTPTRRLVLLQSIPMPLATSEPKIQVTKVLKAFAVNNGKYYIISCADFAENFEKSKKQFTEIIDSLTMTK